MLSKENYEKLRELVVRQGIFVRKQERSLDRLDNILTDVVREFSAVKCEHAMLEEEFGITEDDYKNERES